MNDEVPEDDRQFETVLNRLDALMKRSHDTVVPPPSVEQGAAARSEAPAIETPVVPVLTDVFYGEVISQDSSAYEGNGLPVLTEAFQDAKQAEENVPAFEAVPKIEQCDLEQILREEMPQIRALIAQLVEKELSQARLVLTARLGYEVEQLLLKQLREKIKQK
jgi:hypothetical protein